MSYPRLHDVADHISSAHLEVHALQMGAAEHLEMGAADVRRHGRRQRGARHREESVLENSVLLRHLPVRDYATVCWHAEREIDTTSAEQCGCGEADRGFYLFPEARASS